MENKSERSKRFSLKSDNRLLSILKRLASLFIIMVVFTILSPNFLTLNNLLTVTLQMSIYSLLALGISYVLLIGAAELSAGAVVGLTSMTFVIMMSKGVDFIVAMLISLVIGMLMGFMNGFMVTKMKLIPFIATLGTQYIGRGFCQIMSDGQSMSLRSAVTDDRLFDAFKFIGNGKVFGFLPMATVIVLFFFIIHYIILNKTTFGRNVYAVGSNREAARLSGINSDRVRIAAYLISAFMATMAGFLYMMRTTIAQPSGGQGYEFEGIAACAIGGISMYGGEGNVVGAIIGATTLAVMRNGMNLLGINSFWQSVVTGFAIIGAVYLDVLRKEKESTRL